MARPNKKGLDYFPLNTDFFEDPKIGAIAGEFGIKGEIVAIKLLCTIYREGYFAVWSDMLRLKFLREVSGVNANLLDEIIVRLVRWGFFDETLFNSEHILTSRGIQSRYFNIAKRRSLDVDAPYILVNVNKNGVIADNNHTRKTLTSTLTSQSKVKKSKDITTPTNVVVDNILNTHTNTLQNLKTNFARASAQADTLEEAYGYYKEILDNELYPDFQKISTTEYKLLFWIWHYYPALQLKFDTPLIAWQAKDVCSKFTSEDIRAVVERMANTRDITATNTSFYLTLRSWLRTDIARRQKR